MLHTLFRTIRMAVLVFGAAALCGSASVASAQSYPTRPVRVIVPFPPGGGSDFVGRFIAQKLGESLGQAVIVENKPGAGGNIGTVQGVRAPADGYTITLVASTYTVNPAVYKLDFDSVKDITPIVEISHGPLVVLVNKSLGVNTLQEFIALAKKQPNSIMYASAGKGSIIHAATELFDRMAGIKMVHVPYKGTGPALTDTIAGRTKIFFSSPESALPFVKSGQLKALAVTTSKRVAAFPGVPTVAEAGVPGYEVNLWYGLIAPAGVPQSIVEKLNKATNKILALPDTAQKLVNYGHVPTGGTSEQFLATVAKEVGMWKKLANEGAFQSD